MKKSYKIVIGCVVALFVVVLGFFAFYQLSVSPLSIESKSINFNIPENTAPNTVIKQLEEQGMIKSSFFTKLLMKTKGLSDIKAGIFVIDPSWSSQEILEYINDATNAETNEVMLTIPEGTWAKDVAKRIEELTNVSAKDCLTLWNDPEFLTEMIHTYDFLDESILNKEYFVKLEGYLYPNSYYIYRETDAREVTLVLLDGFNDMIQELKPELKKSDYSIHELVTFASVVQFESGNPEEMPIISSIFHNRFDKGMKMGSSVTVCYALYDKFNNFEDCETNPDIDSPYNTYLVDGLPIGPVNNPGLDAIRAVLKPAKTDYYYFISDIYNTGKLIPAKTYEEHEANVQKYLK